MRDDRTLEVDKIATLEYKLVRISTSPLHHIQRLLLLLLLLLVSLLLISVAWLLLQLWIRSSSLLLSTMLL